MAPDLLTVVLKGALSQANFKELEKMMTDERKNTANARCSFGATHFLSSGQTISAAFELPLSLS